MDIRALIKTCDELIRDGKNSVAAKHLLTVESSRVSRDLRLNVANLCRRTGLIVKGLKLLTPIVIDDRKHSHSPATPQELAEYAILLARAGSTKEALKILFKLQITEVPEIHLFRSLVLFNLWDYETAIPELQLHIADAPNEYSQLLGSINLAAAYLATGDRNSIDEILEACLQKTKSKNYTRLMANVYEMQAQLMIEREDFGKAEAILDHAINIFSQSQTYDQLFVRIWQTYIESFRTKDTAPLERIRNEALVRRRFESVREIDLLRLKIRFDEKLMNHLYFGTPFDHFRKKIVTTLKTEPQSSHFIYGTKETRSLDVVSGKCGDEEAFSRGSVAHRLIEILSRDFYKPFATGSLFGELFPEEFFNIFSGPHRVRQIIHRARAAFIQEKIPLFINQVQGSYTLELGSNFSLTVPKSRAPVDVVTERLEHLHQKFNPVDGFSAKQVADELNLSPSMVRRILATGLEKGRLEKFGASTNTRYYFVGS